MFLLVSFTKKKITEILILALNLNNLLLLLRPTLKFRNNALFLWEGWEEWGEFIHRRLVTKTRRFIRPLCSRFQFRETGLTGWPLKKSHSQH